MTVGRFTQYLATCITLHPALHAQPPRYSFDDAQAFLKTHCQGCHQGKAPAGGFAIQQLASPDTLRSETDRWNKLALRVRNGEMPPKGAAAPLPEAREQFTT